MCVSFSPGKCFPLNYYAINVIFDIVKTKRPSTHQNAIDDTYTHQQKGTYDFSQKSATTQSNLIFYDAISAKVNKCETS